MKTACLDCHSVELRYSDARSIHDIHASLDCSLCHGDNSGLKTADSVHSYLEWVGIGVVSISLAGIIANIIIENKRAKAG